MFLNLTETEKRELREQEMTGRACTLYPRTMELLEQVGVVEDMTQSSYIGRTYAVYQDGKRRTRNGWQTMFPLMQSSFHNYIVNIRQKNSERIFASKYREENRDVYYGWEIVDHRIDQSVNDGYNVTATISNGVLGSRSMRWYVTVSRSLESGMTTYTSSSQ
jgi:phenol 2-monooxygenase (NADPH)